MYNLINELNQNPTRWSLIFTIARGLRLLHDARLLSKPKDSEEYAKDLWMKMLNVTKRKYLKYRFWFIYLSCRN